MARPDHRLSRPLQPAALSLISLACLAALHVPAHAQGTDITLPTVTIRSAGSAAPADVTGFGDQPASSVPISTTVIDSRTISDIGARRISDLYQLDASVTDAYNAVGFYDYASVRGFVIDNTYNFRREGLPISAETSLPIDHLQRVELLKGTSGIQAGTSAPGGLINLVVKRPTAQPQRSFRTEVNEDGNALVHLDMSGRAGEGDLGWRLNIAGERLNTEARGTEGKRGLLALAMDARLSRDSLLEGEFEISRRRQPAVPGLSLLGTALPPADPRININTQPWSQPTDFRNFSGSLRFTQAINSQWNWQAQLGTQRLKTDDFLAYPYGCSAEDNFDRYCSNGSFDIYDYRSFDERRNTTAAQFKVNGRLEAAGLQHDLSFGVLASRFTVRGNDRFGANPLLATGNVFTLPAVAPATAPDDSFTNRTERSTEFFVTDVIRWGDAFQTWAGLRHTRLERDSIRTGADPRATSYEDSFTTPWLAASLKLDAQRTVYASWGQGVESEVAPGRARYTNQGLALPPLKSRQWETGIRSTTETTRWSLAYFRISRPISNDLNGCTSTVTVNCRTRVIDGSARHQGIELGGGRTVGPWDYNASLTWIDAERQGSTIDLTLNGLRPTNVPRYVLRANVGRRIDALPGLSAHAHLSHEGRRAVTPENDVELGSWTRVDASLRYATQVQGKPASWVLGIDNLFDRRYFQEAPFQYGHIYLFPAASRTVRVAFESQF